MINMKTVKEKLSEYLTKELIKRYEYESDKKKGICRKFKLVKIT